MHDEIDAMKHRVQGLNFDYDHLKDSIKTMQDVTQKLSEDSINMTIQMDEYKQSYADLVAKLQGDINLQSEALQALEIKVTLIVSTDFNFLVRLKRIYTVQTVPSQI